MFLFRIPVICLFLVGMAICHEHRSGSTKLSDHDVKFQIGHRNDTAQAKARVSEVSRSRDTEGSILFLPDIVVIPPREITVRTPKPFYPDDFFHMIAEGNNSKSRHHTTVSNSRPNSHHTAPASTTRATAATRHTPTSKTTVPTVESTPTRRPKVTTTGTTAPVSHTQPSFDHTTLPKSTTWPTLVTGTPTTERFPDNTRVPSSLRTTSAPDIRTTGLSSDNTPVPTSSIRTTPATGIATTGLPSIGTTATTSASTQDVTDSVKNDTNDADLGSTTDANRPFSPVTAAHGVVTTGTITGDHEMRTTAASLSDSTTESVTKMLVPFSASGFEEGLSSSSSPNTSTTDLPGTSPTISTEKSVKLHEKSQTPSMPTIRDRMKERTIETLLMAPAELIAGEEMPSLRGHQGGGLTRVGGKRTAQLEHILEEMMAELVPRVRDYIQDFSHKQKLNFLDEFIQKYKAQILHP